MNVSQVIKRLGDHVRRQQRAKAVDFVDLVRLLADGGEPANETEVLGVLEGAQKSFEQLAEAVEREQQRRRDLVIVARREAVAAAMAECHRETEDIRAETIEFNTRMGERGRAVAARIAGIHAEQAAILHADERLRSEDLNDIQREEVRALPWMDLLRRERQLEDLLNPSGGVMGFHRRTPGRALTNAREELRQARKNAKTRPARIVELEATVATCQATVDGLEKERGAIRAQRADLARRESAVILGTGAVAGEIAPPAARKRR